MGCCGSKEEEPIEAIEGNVETLQNLQTAEGGGSAAMMAA